MKKMLLVWIAAAAGLLPSLSLTVNHSKNLDHAPARLTRSSEDSDLLSRVPGFRSARSVGVEPRPTLGGDPQDSRPG